VSSAVNCLEVKVNLKKLTLLIALSVILAACGGVATQIQPETAPVYDDAAMATQISQLLTAMPTTTSVLAQPQVNTSQPDQPSPTPSSTYTSTVLVVNTPDGTATPLPTAETTQTEEVLQPSETVEVTNTPTPTMTPTATITSPANDPRLSLGDPDWNDPLDNGQNWLLEEDPFLALGIEDSHLVMTGLTGTSGWRMATTPQLIDFYAEMTVSPTECSGRDYYGFIFRVPVINSPDQGYLFGVSCSGGYSLKKWDGQVEPNGQTTTLVDWTPGESIVSGSNQANRVGVMVVGSRITLYANGVLLQEIHDETYPEGYLGIFINSEETENFTIHVDDVSYWRNP
jgi:hypothetical protein